MRIIGIRAFRGRYTRLYTAAAKMPVWCVLRPRLGRAMTSGLLGRRPVSADGDRTFRGRRAQRFFVNAGSS